MQKKPSKATLNLKDINSVWDFLAWFINLISQNPLKAILFFIIIGLVFGGFTIKTSFFSFEQNPVNLNLDGVGSINQKKK